MSVEKAKQKLELTCAERSSSAWGSPSLTNIPIWLLKKDENEVGGLEIKDLRSSSSTLDDPLTWARLMSLRSSKLDFVHPFAVAAAIYSASPVSS